MQDHGRRVFGIEGMVGLGVVDVGDALELEVETVARAACCRWYGRAWLPVTERPVVRVRDLPLAGRATVLRWRKRRYGCDAWRADVHRDALALQARQRVSGRFSGQVVRARPGRRGACRGRARGAHAPSGRARVPRGRRRAARNGSARRRQSSIARTRSASWPGAQTSRTSNDCCRAETVRSPSMRAVAASTVATVFDRLCASAPMTIIVRLPSTRSAGLSGSPADTSESGPDHLSSHAVDPRGRRATRHPPVRPNRVDRKSVGQPAASSRTFRTCRTPPPDSEDSGTEKVKSVPDVGARGPGARAR